MAKKFNFSEIMALVVDHDRFSTGIISQILRGFGLNNHFIVGTGEAAKKLLPSGRFHLLICESVLQDMSLADLVRWLRRRNDTKIRYMPVVVLTGYTQFSRVTHARDAGVSSVVRKPVSPATLFDHILWAARTERPFIDADAFAGPDRRFWANSAAVGLSRRASDHGTDDLPHPPAVP
ncbi:MAG: response regulator [Rhizomicrobium sp.]|nr:response regulator [Rhizomicrobium sp.]